MFMMQYIEYICIGQSDRYDVGDKLTRQVFRGKHNNIVVVFQGNVKCLLDLDYFNMNFITITEWRKQKINNLL